MVPLTAMKVTVTVSLVVVHVCMILVVVAVPALVVTPVPAVVPSGITSVLPAMLPLMLTRMTNVTIVTVVAPLMSSIAIVERDERSTDVESKTKLLMLSVRRYRKCPDEGHNNTDLDQKFFHDLLDTVNVIRNISFVH